MRAVHPSAPESAQAETSEPRLESPWVLGEARRVLSVERDALERVASGLDEGFAEAVRLLHQRVHQGHGRVVVSGVGKSGIVARKVAATLTSTGTPSLFVHPVDGVHGDLGLVAPEDVALLISKSGATDELQSLLEALLRRGVPVVAMTGDRTSELARPAQVVLDVSVAEEACSLQLAPTSSTTAQMALGDALAVVLLGVRGFGAEDFARLHPGGSLGRRLLTRVADLMVGDDYPAAREHTPMRDAVELLAHKRGTVPVVDGEGLVVGVVTAGDLTRLMQQEDAFLDVAVGDVMTRDPKVVSADSLAASAVHLMEAHGIMALPVTDGEGRLCGVVHLHDLMRARVL